MQKIEVSCAELATQILLEDADARAEIAKYEIRKVVDPAQITRGIGGRLHWMGYTYDACVVHAGSETRAELETEAPTKRLQVAIEWYLHTDPAFAAWRIMNAGEKTA